MYETVFGSSLGDYKVYDDEGYLVYISKFPKPAVMKNVPEDKKNIRLKKKI
ncbi:MAG TPA: hypothetical protein VHA52_10110 [Candidatus Babeliaceae bacterium]|nr:hypothetical protein [Candidatus Babeliaceae bacterium]